MSTRAKRRQKKGRESKMVRGDLGTEEFSSQVRDIIRHLRIIQSAVIVSKGALKGQNCEMDLDVASTLRHSVVDRLQTQIERLACLGGLSDDDEGETEQ